MNDKNYTGFRWLILAAMFIVTAISSIFLIAPAPLISEMMKTMTGVSAGQVAFITMSVFNIFVIISAILGGPLLDKFGAVKIYIGGLILISIGALLTPIMGSSFGGLIFIRVLQGAGTGPIMVSVLPIAALYFPTAQRSILIVIQGIAVSAGIKIGLMIAPRIFQATGSWQTALAWLALFSILGLILSLIVASQSEGHAFEPDRAASFTKDLKLSLIKPVTWVVIVILALFAWMYQGFNDLVPGYLSAAPPAGLGHTPELMGSLMSASQILIILGGIIGVIITEKFLKGNARPVILAGFILSAVFIYMIKSSATASDQMIMAVSVYATAFFQVFIQPQALGYIAKYYPKNITGTLGGFAVGISGIVSMAGISAGSLLIQTSGYHASINLLVAIAFIGAVIALFLKPVNE